MKITLKLFLSLFIVLILCLNLSLCYEADFAERGNLNKSVYSQLRFLKARLRNGVGDSMQQVYPEGFVFINAMYGLSWCNLIANLDPTHPVYTEGLEEVDWVLAELYSDKAKASFSDLLPLPYGAFYTGWTNYVLSQRIRVTAVKDQKYEEHLSQFTSNCERISKSVQGYNSPFLPSYFRQCWPADMLVAVNWRWRFQLSSLLIVTVLIYLVRK